tara:strand:+ start:1506 stop:1760 length:255 start_codon:yes stop_codon:yes gene_type:complete
MTADYSTLLEMWREEKQKREKAEDRIKELNNSLSIALEINDKYQRENVAIRRRTIEVEEDNKKLSKQISDYIKNHEDKFRKAGM